jgi:hypothetical protein
MARILIVDWPEAHPLDKSRPGKGLNKRENDGETLAGGQNFDDLDVSPEVQTTLRVLSLQLVVYLDPNKRQLK